MFVFQRIDSCLCDYRW